MRTRLLIKLTVVALVLLGVNEGSKASAQDAGSLRDLQVDDYFALKSVGSPRISPDGAWVAFTVRSQDLDKDSRETRIWMVSTAGGEAIPMTAAGSSAWRPRWSPDGKFLTFLSGREWEAISGTQVFTLDLRGGEGIPITNIEHGVESYEWSPDGKRLALVIRDPKPSPERLPAFAHAAQRDAAQLPLAVPDDQRDRLHSPGSREQADEVVGLSVQRQVDFFLPDADGGRLQRFDGDVLR